MTISERVGSLGAEIVPTPKFLILVQNLVHSASLLILSKINTDQELNLSLKVNLFNKSFKFLV